MSDGKTLLLLLSSRPKMNDRPVTVLRDEVMKPLAFRPKNCKNQITYTYDSSLVGKRDTKHMNSTVFEDDSHECN